MERGSIMAGNAGGITPGSIQGAEGIPETCGFQRQANETMWDSIRGRYYQLWKTLIPRSLGRFGFHMYSHDYPEMQRRWKSLAGGGEDARLLVNAMLSIIDMAMVSTGRYTKADSTITMVITEGTSAFADTGWRGAATKTISRMGGRDPLWDADPRPMLAMVPKAVDMLEEALPVLGRRMPGLRLPACRRMLACNLADMLSKGWANGCTPSPWETIGRALIGDHADSLAGVDDGEDADRRWERLLPMLVMSSFSDTISISGVKTMLQWEQANKGAEPDGETMSEAFRIIINDMAKQCAAKNGEGVGGDNPLQMAFLQDRSFRPPYVVPNVDRPLGAHLSGRMGFRLQTAANPMMVKALVEAMTALASSGVLADPRRLVNATIGRTDKTAGILTDLFMGEAACGYRPSLNHDLPRGFFMETLIARTGTV